MEMRGKICPFSFFKWSMNYHNRGMIDHHTVNPKDYLPVGRRHLNLESGGKKVENEHMVTQCEKSCFCSWREYTTFQ